MRTIKFRGKTYKGEWVYGDLLHSNGKYRVKLVLVLKDTIGQYTGLCDRAGKEIYDGDIVSLKFEYFGKNGIVTWHEDIFGFVLIIGEKIVDMDKLHIHKVVGNIHDNPELLQKRK